MDDAYEAGVCICAAAGNHVGITPPRTLVYPARYPPRHRRLRRDGRRPPVRRSHGRGALEGSFGPDSAMKAAIAAYTPNIPWAALRLQERRAPATARAPRPPRRRWPPPPRSGSRSTRTSCRATGARRGRAPRPLQHRQAKVRRAKHFGNGVLQARAALDVRPVARAAAKSEPSDDSFAFLRVITGLGIAEPPPREQMFNLELAQRWLLNEGLQEIVPDPEAASALSGATLRRFMEAVIEDDGASLALRKHVAARYPVAARPVRRRGTT